MISACPVRSRIQNARGLRLASQATAPISAASALIADRERAELGVEAAHRYSPRYQIRGARSAAISAAVTAPMPIV